MSEEQTPNAEQTPPVHPEPPERDPQVRKQARLSVLKYGAARFGLFVALTIVIQLLSAAIVAPLPIAITALLALIVAFPLSVFLFKNLRLETTAAVAEWDAQRKACKAWVKQELSSR